MARASSLPPVGSVLILTKHRYIGDTIVATPLLHAVRRAFPGARVRLATGAAAACVLRGCPDVDEILTSPICPVGTDRRFRAGLRQMLDLRRRDRPDLCLIADRAFGAALAACAAGGRVRSGFDTEGRGCLLTHRVAYGGTRHETELCLDLLRAVAPASVDAPAGLPRLTVTEEEIDAAWARLAERHITPDTLLIGMQPGSKDRVTREWGAERFAAVADGLADQFGARILLLGTADERVVAQRVADAMRTPPPLILSGETGIREALALVACCRLWIANDGGLLHAAVALGRPTVGVFAAAKVARWGYNTPRNRTLFAPPVLSGGSPEAQMRSSLDALCPEVVLSHAADLLGAGRCPESPRAAQIVGERIGCLVS